MSSASAELSDDSDVDDNEFLGLSFGDAARELDDDDDIVSTVGVLCKACLRGAVRSDMAGVLLMLPQATAVVVLAIGRRSKKLNVLVSSRFVVVVGSQC